MKHLKSNIYRTIDISSGDRKTLFAIMDKYYNNMDETKFLDDLNEKDKVIILRDAKSGSIKGFSTLMYMHLKILNKPIKAIYSGDTVIEKDSWGTMELVRSFGQCLLDLAREDSPAVKYWFLISKGYKTYFYLPLNFNSFFPCFNKSTPNWEKMVLDGLGQMKFGRRYIPHKGIISHKVRSQSVRRLVADITPDQLKDPHINFFAQCNPGYPKGDQLACIAELNEKNFSDAFYEIVYDERLGKFNRAKN